MCGFFAEYRKKNYHFNKKLFLSSAIELSHRGPDDNGEIYLQYFSAKFFRLSIQDLSTKANQPMISKDGRFIILFNGEIYNFLDLKKKYSLKPFTNSDTEVILLLFQKIKLKILDELEGMFSIVIYDQTKNTCFFLRDRFGIKPLYFFNDDKKILFSSEIKPLLNYIKKKINYNCVLDYFLRQTMDNNNKTFFENINSLEPGNYGIINSNKLIIKKYWNFQNKKKNKLSLKENQNNIKTLFFSSVKKHLISDRKIGFFFSGGSDSLSIVSHARQLINQPQLFTYNFKSLNGELYGEDEKAKQIAKSLNLSLDITTVTSKMVIENFDKVIKICEAPITSIRQVCDYLLFQKFKKLNIPVAIIGHGGDELLGGYDYNFLFFLKDKYKKNLNTNGFLQDLFNYLDLDIKDNKKNEELILNYLISLTYQVGSNKDCTPFIDINNFSPKFLNKNLNEEFYNLNIKKNLNYLKNSQLMDIQQVSLPRNLRHCDRLSMANGIEARVPFLDNRLSDYLFNLDNNLKFKNYQTRWIFKSVFKKKKTFKYFSSKKNSVPDPQSIWLKTDLREFFMDEFLSMSFKKNQIFNYRNVINNLNLFHKNKLKSSFGLFQIFTFHKFIKQFGF